MSTINNGSSLNMSDNHSKKLKNKLTKRYS